MEKKKHSEPFVFKVVAEAKLPVKVWEVGGTEAGGFVERRKRESEGLVLPYIVGGECRDSGDDLEVKGLEVGEYVGGVAGAQRCVGKYGVEDGIVRESGAALIEDGGRRKGVGRRRHCVLSELRELCSYFL